MISSWARFIVYESKLHHYPDGFYSQNWRANVLKIFK